jgi:hypothetical protein
MKKTLTAATLAVATAIAGTALAQPPGWGEGPGWNPAGTSAQPAYGPGSGMGLRRNPQAVENRVQRMSQALGLTDAQQAEIRGVLEDRRAGRITSRDETHARIASVLNEDQRAQLDQWRATRPYRQGGGAYGPGRGGMPGWGRGMGPGAGYGPGMGRGPAPGYGGGPFGPGY